MHSSSPNKLEKLLLKFAGICIAVLVCTQIIMLHDGLRQLFSQIDHIEGQTLLAGSEAEPSSSWYSVIENRLTAASLFNHQRKSKSVLIRMIKPQATDRAWVTVNGQRVTDFRYGETSVTVYEGDYLELDCDQLSSLAQFVVKVPQHDIVIPSDGMFLEGTRGTITVGKVKFQ